MSEIVADARKLACGLLEPLGRRWRHVQAVARCGRTVADRSGLSGGVLEAACWLHDIGYAAGVQATGFHPLDGARYLRRQGWIPEVVSLVAHHSCARFEAAERGLGEELSREFVRPLAEYEDALCFCDMTSSPDGDLVTPSDRLDEIEKRYGPGDVVTRFIGVARPEILAAVARVEARLAASSDTS